MYKFHCIKTMLRAEEVPGDLEASKLLRFQMANAGEKLSMTGRCLDMKAESPCLLQRLVTRSAH